MQLDTKIGGSMEISMVKYAGDIHLLSHELLHNGVWSLGKKSSIHMVSIKKPINWKVEFGVGYRGGGHAGKGG